MKSKAENRQWMQEAGVGTRPAVERVRQLLLGMVAGMAAAKHDLMEWVQEVGLAALNEVFEADATAIAGPKGKHLAERTTAGERRGRSCPSEVGGFRSRGRGCGASLAKR